MAFYLVINFIDWPFIFAPYSIPGCVLAAKAHFLQRRGQKVWAERKKRIKIMVIQYKTDQEINDIFTGGIPNHLITLLSVPISYTAPSTTYKYRKASNKPLHLYMHHRIKSSLDKQANCDSLKGLGHQMDWAFVDPSIDRSRPK